MKKIINIYLLALSFVLVTSCDNGFDELNTSKTGATALDPALVLNNAIINSSPTSSLNYEIAVVQQWYSSNSGVLVGGNYNQKNIGNTKRNSLSILRSYRNLLMLRPHWIQPARWRRQMFYMRVTLPGGKNLDILCCFAQECIWPKLMLPKHKRLQLLLLQGALSLRMPTMPLLNMMRIS